MTEVTVMFDERLRPGDPAIWRATVSNYGHQRDVPVVVLSIGPQRVRVETRYGDGKPERRVLVKPENLRTTRNREAEYISNGKAWPSGRSAL